MYVCAQFVHTTGFLEPNKRRPSKRLRLECPLFSNFKVRKVVNSTKRLLPVCRPFKRLRLECSLFSNFKMRKVVNSTLPEPFRIY